MEYRLYNEPVLGDWTITTTINGRKTSQTFSVLEYGKLDAMTESGYSKYSDQVRLEMGHKKVIVGSDQETAQSERNSLSKNLVVNTKLTTRYLH